MTKPEGENQEPKSKKKKPFWKWVLAGVVALVLLPPSVDVYNYLKLQQSAREILNGHRSSLFEVAMGHLWLFTAPTIEHAQAPRDLTLKDSPYKTYFSGYWAGPGMTPLFWMDDNRVIFTGSNTPDGSGPSDLLIWEVGKGVTQYRTNAYIQCFADGKIIFTDGNPGEAFYGAFGNEARIDGYKFINTHSCEPLMEDPLQMGKRQQPLRKQDGYLEESNNIDPETKRPFLTYHKTNGDTVEFPIAIMEGWGYLFYPADYYQFKDAYLLYKTGNWPEENARPLQWLYSDGRIESFNVSSPWSGGYWFYPTKLGLFYSGYDFRMPVRERRNVVLLFKDMAPIEVMTKDVFASKVSVSPNGCRVAFIANDMARKFGSRDFLYVIDLCSSMEDVGFMDRLNKGSDWDPKTYRNQFSK